MNVQYGSNGHLHILEFEFHGDSRIPLRKISSFLYQLRLLCCNKSYLSEIKSMWERLFMQGKMTDSKLMASSLNSWRAYENLTDIIML
jgi:hypothetical protein